MFKSLFAYRFLKRRQLFQDQARRLFQLDGQRRIQNVRGSQAKVHVTRRVPDLLGDAGKKSDDVVFHFLFDRVDAGDIEPGVFFNLRERPARYLALVSQSLASVYFDIEPDAEFIFRRPDSRHFRQGVSFYQFVGLSKVGKKIQVDGWALVPYNKHTDCKSRMILNIIRPQINGPIAS